MNGVATAQAEQRQLGSLQKELARIGNLIEKGKTRLEGLQVNEAEEKRLLEVIPQLQTQERELLDKVSRLKGAETEALRSHDKVSTKHKKVDEAYRTTSDLHHNARDRHRTVSRQVEVLEGDRESIAAGNREEVRLKIAKADPVLIATDKALASLRAQIVEGKRDLASMASKRTESKKLSASIAASNKRARQLEADIAQKLRILKQKGVEVDTLDEKLEVKKRAHDAECAQKSAELDAREKTLMQREGRTNRIVQWIKDRAGKLTQAKREIEDFRGKDLSHIIIPDVSELE